MGYNPRFWCTQRILEERHPWFTAVWPSPKLLLSTILVSFMGSFGVPGWFETPVTSGSLKFGCPQNSWFQIKHSSGVSSMISMARDPWYTPIEKTPKHVVSVTSGHICGPYRTILEPMDDFRDSRIRYTTTERSSKLAILSNSGRFYGL